MPHSRLPGLLGLGLVLIRIARCIGEDTTGQHGSCITGMFVASNRCNNWLSMVWGQLMAPPGLACGRTSTKLSVALVTLRLESQSAATDPFFFSIDVKLGEGTFCRWKS